MAVLGGGGGCVLGTTPLTSGTLGVGLASACGTGAAASDGKRNMEG